ncbi:vacuolar protein sorting-associated protein 13A-like [Colias croceus]|uniref:vacuolar protein sorting-associated protein 13A-like n=1 Tax=Colias crocea TaxID=72248 RepID=UPI001E281367|nr:vacuolar protein sorting-associated protein 13A-like [Colias croceus]
MFEGAVAGILNRLLGKYVQDLDTENLNVGIFSGNVNLTELKLKPEALYELDLPIDVKIGTIGRVNLQIPWSGLYTQPVVVNIEDVLILVGPAISNSYFDPEREKRLTRAAKRKILQDLEAESEVLKGPQNFFENLFTAIVNNLQIYIRNVHVRYEDSISSKDGPLACGLCLQSLSIETTNSKWKPSVTPANASTVYQMMRIESLSLYWNPTATALDDVEIANITPMQYYNWKHYMLTGLDKFSMHHEDFEFLLKPVTCKVKVLINRSGEARVPRLLLDAVLQDSALQLSRRQYLSIDNLLASFRRIQLNRKHRHLHPGIPLSKGIKKWWKYAYNVVLEQRVRPYTWAAIKKHRENYNIYKKTYKSLLRSPNDIELKMDLQKCEDNLPIISVVIAREQAKFELLSQEPESIDVVETEFDWWKVVGSSDAESDSDNEKSRVELCVKAERNKTLWSHLSSPEKKKVCELIGYVEGAPRQDKSKQYIEHKLNLTLANCSLTLINRSKEVLVVTLTQFLASLETRPSAKAYKLSLRADNLVVEGVSSDGELVHMLITARESSMGTALAVDVERNPINSHADLGITWLMEPVELVYVEHGITELINFFQTHSMSSRELLEEVSSALEQAGNISKSVLAYAVSRKKVFNLNVDFKGPTVLVPEHGCMHKPGRLIVIDVNRIIIKTDLQPSNLVLEDATCMELEEKLYDRFHAECSFQILFCDWNEPWRESRKLGDSEHHLVPRVKSQLVFSTSIRKDYKLLPRYKLNISLSSLKLNISDRIIGLLLDFLDNLPIPVPNTVPVSFMDSGDYTEDCMDPELVETLQRDRILADPGYGDLVKLRRKIVAAYFSRNRVPDTQADGGPTHSPTVESLPPADLSDEDVEEYARSVDLPGFDDNVSPSNNIGTLLRFIIGEIVINLNRSSEQVDKPYIMLSVTKLCLDFALMAFGPAIQLSVGSALLTDKQHHSNNGQYLELLTTDGELFNLLYRKVRAHCPEFRSHFHAVEQALVADAGHVALLAHAPALHTLVKYIAYLAAKVQQRHALNMKSMMLPRTKRLWDLLMQPEADTPVPPGATKFSYSMRISSVSIRAWQADGAVEWRARSLDSDCVFRADDRLVFRLFLGSLQLDDLSDATLYPKLIWPDEDKVLELKYVRSAGGVRARPRADLRVHVGRLHVVLFCSLLYNLQQFLELLVPSSAATEAAVAAERAAQEQAAELRTSALRVSLAIEIHAPVLLLPQKPSSPNLLVFNLGDLMIENFFKTVNISQEANSPIQSPVIDNVLFKLDNITLSRAVMTLAGTLEVQEPILESISVRCDLKRTIGYAQVATIAAYRDLLLCEADIVMDTVNINIGQKDLATLFAVWTDNLSEGNYIGTIVPSSPVELAPSDVQVKKLQAFFAQGEPIRKESVIRFTLEGVELKLFSDLDEVLSSPVRDLNHGLAKLTTGEMTVVFDYFSDNSMEMKASLQSLLIEDIRPDTTIVIRRIFQSQGGGSRSAGGIAVVRPALLELALRRSARAASADVRLERTRLNLAPPFLIHLARTLLSALPGDKTMDGGVVNHGYVGDAPHRTNNNRAARFPSSSDSTSGYFSTSTSVSEEVPSLSISIQCRQPEIMFFTDLNKTEGHALLLRTELLVDYSFHSNTETLVISLAGLQVMSKLQSKLKNLPPQLVLKPCDVEFSKSFKSIEEGVKVKLSVSEIDMHIAATTIHTVMDIIEEVTTELAIPDEKEMFNFSTYNPQSEKHDEDLWAPKKVAPYLPFHHEDTYQPKFSPGKPTETLNVIVPIIRVMFEIEQTVRIPVLLVKLSTELTLYDWSGGARGRGAARLAASAYNERLDVWEPLLEPVLDGNRQVPFEISATVFQAKSYPMSARLSTNEQEESMSDHVPETKKSKKRKEFESETSADEADTDNEMTFLRNPNEKERKYNMDFETTSMSFLRALDADDSNSDSDVEKRDKMSYAMGHLFIDSESSADEMSNDEDSSAPEQSDKEEVEEEETPETFADADDKKEEKSVTLQEPEREDSVESTPEDNRLCTYVVLESRSLLSFTLGPASARALRALADAVTDRNAVVTAIVTAENGLQLINDIGPGSTVQLRARNETDLPGNDRVIATADYDIDTSRPSTPGCDTSGADLLDEIEKETKQEMTDISDEWDCFEGGFGSNAQCGTQRGSPGAPRSPAALQRRLTAHTLHIRLQGFDPLTIHCPQRAVSKLHVLNPSKNGTRYYVAVERTAKYNAKKIVVRSPLQVRNETSYAVELLYRQSELEAAGAGVTGVEVDGVAGVTCVGSVRNPFCGLLRLAVLAPHDTYNVPLYIAYHCRLYLLPTNFEGYKTSIQGIWWMDLVGDLETPRDIVCPALEDSDPSVFAMRILPVEGCQSNAISRSIPNLLVRVLAPLAIHNRIPHALQAHATLHSPPELISGLGVPGKELSVRLEAGERAHLYTLPPGKQIKFTLDVHYLGLPWTGRFTYSPEMSECTVSMRTECETEGGNKRLAVRARLERGPTARLLLYAPYWLVNKTALPLQIKGRSDVCYEASEEPLLWTGGGRRAGVLGVVGSGVMGVARGERVRVRAHQSGWSRAAPLAAAAPGLLVCAHTERKINYRILLQVTLSELSPQLTKIVTLLPYFIVYNDTKKHLRYMEENEAADLWMDLAPQQCVPFWPQTDSLAMHCKYRDSMLVSQHFPIAENHFTVLRMDKGSAICVEVTGGTDRPYTITFKNYRAGDAPVRIDNLCEDLFLKLHQADSGQVALLSPYQSMLYTWDDPLKERNLLWNIYNNKGKGFPANFSQDGYGQEKVSFHSVKQSTLVVTNSVTSKLSSTLKRLTPKSPEPMSSSSDDSDVSEQPETARKTKKMRKDKVIVYWISYMDGYQRVFALTQDERIAYQYKMSMYAEKSNYEIYMALSSISLSVCVQTGNRVKELSYISVSDSLPRWEVNVSNKWKQLAPDLTAWIEDNYQADMKKCQLKEYIHIDLEKMQMTKPFFSELRRTYNPGVWLQLRRSETFTYCHLKLQRLQIDNQLHEAVFPCVLYPAPLPSHLKSRREKPSVEIELLKQYRPSLNQDIYKNLKIVIQEYCVNLDRGFVNHVFDILNHWKVDEKPAVRLRADLALVHMPLPVIAMKSQSNAQRNVIFEYVHLSPIKIVLSLSSRGYSGEDAGSPSRKFGGQKENRPKLFNSDLLEYLFNSWGSSLCDMKDVVIRMSYFELRNTPLPIPCLLDAASRHYWLQLVQQFYVLVLGLKILGNPYSYIGDFTKALRQFYEPYVGFSRRASASDAVLSGAARMLASEPHATSTPHKIAKTALGSSEIIDDLPEAVIEANRTNPASVALAVTGIIARPTFDICREVSRLAQYRRAGAGCAEAALRACAERCGGLVARRRLPRDCSSVEGIRAYSPWSARGAALLAQLCRGHYADTDGYLAHAHLSRTSTATVLVTTQHVFVVRSAGRGGRWRAEWAAPLHRLLGAPAAAPPHLVLSVRQDEQVSYFSTDEKAIEIQDPEVLSWLRSKIECALVQALEDTRCNE